VVVSGFHTLLGIPGRPSDESNQYAKFSHQSMFKPLGLLRSPVFKKIEPFCYPVKKGTKIVVSKIVQTFSFELVKYLSDYSARKRVSGRFMSLREDSMLSRANSYGM